MFYLVYFVKLLVKTRFAPLTEDLATNCHPTSGAWCDITCLCSAFSDNPIYPLLSKLKVKCKRLSKKNIPGLFSHETITHWRPMFVETFPSLLHLRPQHFAGHETLQFSLPTWLLPFKLSVLLRRLLRTCLSHINDVWCWSKYCAVQNDFCILQVKIWKSEDWQLMFIL